jgi:hypothetical protein
LLQELEDELKDGESDSSDTEDDDTIVEVNGIEVLEVDSFNQPSCALKLSA